MYWFSFSGLGTAYVIFPQGFVEDGKYFKIASACGLNRLTGTIAFGNGWPVNGFVMVRAFPLDWHPADSNWLKSPVSAAAVGT